MKAGIDSYVLVEEADKYINKHYRTASKDRQRWDNIIQTDKEVLLVNACAEMEQLPFRGRKVTVNQVLSFPRLPFQYGLPQEPPQDVKAAQVELALWLSDDVAQAEYSKRAELQRQGVTSFSLGDLSESYGAGQKPAPLSCHKVATLLSNYLNGGFSLC